MNRLTTFVTIIFVLAGAYVYFFPWTTVRFKLTAEFDTPQGIKTGSGVVEVTYGLTIGDFISRFYKLTTSVRGDAIAIDVAKNQTVYVLADAGIPGGILFSFNKQRFSKEDALLISKISKWSGSTRLLQENHPLLATLGDPKNRSTVKGFDPTSYVYPGTRLLGVTAAVTQEPVTRIIHKRLPWLTETPFKFPWSDLYDPIPRVIVRTSYGDRPIYIQDFRS